MVELKVTTTVALMADQKGRKKVGSWEQQSVEQSALKLAFLMDNYWVAWKVMLKVAQWAA